MNQETVPQENPYNNEVAFKDLLKMMRRKDLITASFVLDRYGYESFEVESKVMDIFIIHLNNDLFGWIFKYLLFGEIDEPIPSPTEELIIATSYVCFDLNLVMTSLYFSQLDKYPDYLQKRIDLWELNRAQINAVQSGWN